MRQRFRNILIFMLFLAAGALARERPYVILISLDGFRWDYLDRGLSPNLEFIRRHGVSALSLEPVFPTKTFPNHLSIITGLYPENHGILFNRFRDPFSGRAYALNRPEAVRDGRWYLGEPFWQTAERQGIICASYFWPGSEIEIDYRRPTYYEPYEHERPYETRVRGVLNWLQLPAEKRPHFITLYFDAVDSKGHRYGTGAAETDSAIVQVDRMIGLLIRGLRDLNLLNKTNIIVVSDHGMLDVSREKVIRVDEMLKGIPCTFQQSGPVVMVQPDSGYVEAAHERLQQQARHYRVYRRQEMPDYWRFSDHPFITDLILIADPGWSLLTSDRPLRGRATHGWDNHLLAMHGIFLAMGPNFKEGYRTGTVKNIDIYPLLCKIFDILPRQPIDGSLERIGFLLK